MDESDRRLDPLAEARRQWAVRHDAVEPMAAVTALVRAQQLVLARIGELLAPFELTFARYEVLQLLAFSRRGALPLGKIGERLMVHPTSVTNSVDRLEAHGLVRRVRDADDGRIILAELTAAGRDVAGRATAALVAARFGLDGVSDAEAARLGRELSALRARLGDEVEPSWTASEER